MEKSGQIRKAMMMGTVVGKNARKTLRVEVEKLIKHPLYKKVIRRKKTFLVHDEKEVCKVGDQVRIIESRPISKLKRWRVYKILNQKMESKDRSGSGGES